ncbi:hypothetical protein NHJ13051_004833, partial [Beauveria bassiana]
MEPPIQNVVQRWTSLVSKGRATGEWAKGWRGGGVGVVRIVREGLRRETQGPLCADKMAWRGGRLDGEEEKDKEMPVL